MYCSVTACEEAYKDYNEQLACFIGCNLNNNEEDVYTNNNTEVHWGERVCPYIFYFT